MITIAMNLATMLAVDPPATAPSGGGGSFFTSQMFPFILIAVIFMVFMTTSKRKQTNARQAMLTAIKRGDRVYTTSGIIGTVVEVREGEFVLKVDETNNTKIKFLRDAILRVINEEEKTEAKP